MRFCVLILFLAFPILAVAASTNSSGPAIASAQNASCGSTIAEALQRARAALGTQSDHATLACLVEAVSAMQAQNPVKVREDGDSVLVLPKINTDQVR
jgi:hypothetical protein